MDERREQLTIPNRVAIYSTFRAQESIRVGGFGVARVGIG